MGQFLYAGKEFIVGRTLLRCRLGRCFCCAKVAIGNPQPAAERERQKKVYYSFQASSASIYPLQNPLFILFDFKFKLQCFDAAGALHMAVLVDVVKLKPDVFAAGGAGHFDAPLAFTYQ